MKLDVTVHDDSQARHHRVELRCAPADASTLEGEIEVMLDGQTIAADCARVAPGVYSILIDGKSYEVHASRPPGEAQGRWAVEVGGQQFLVEVRDPRRRRDATPTATLAGPQEILAPMPGKVVKVLVSEEQDVRAGQGLLVIEAMKMQNELRAPRAGRVEKVYVGEGKGVETGSRLISLAPLARPLT